IRDRNVTGVQTCALPILKNGPVIPEDLESKTLELVYKYNMENNVIYSSFDHHSLQRLHKLDPKAKISLLFHINLLNFFDYVDHRSEERRVGKECRSREIV